MAVVSSSPPSGERRRNQHYKPTSTHSFRPAHSRVTQHMPNEEAFPPCWCWPPTGLALHHSLYTPASGAALRPRPPAHLRRGLQAGLPNHRQSHLGGEGGTWGGHQQRAPQWRPSAGTATAWPPCCFTGTVDLGGRCCGAGARRHRTQTSQLWCGSKQWRCTFISSRRGACSLQLAGLD